MSGDELRRVEILARVQSGDLKVVDAAEMVGVSYRQAKRDGNSTASEERKDCSMATLAGSRIVPSRKPCGGRCWG